MLPMLDSAFGRKPVLNEEQPAVRFKNPSHFA
jgi:hypothetical protein